ncbi:MAG TPA: hypothetical protein VMT74_01660 [Gaiellaceae bacterium]|nr:hypothetical protein [Gaiellaceae bacterium]
MPNPIQAADAIIALECAQREYRAARSARRQAMRAATSAGAPLRDVARAAECSHEAVRRLANSDGAVVLTLGVDEYPLTEEQVEMLVYKLAGSARGAFPKDIELLGAGTGWLESAAELATVMHDAQASDDEDSIVLDDHRAFAMYQVLRLTYTGRPTVLSHLYDTLTERFGHHVIGGMRQRSL